MSSVLPVTDPKSWGPEARNAVERWFLPRLRDPRDIFFVRQAAFLSALFVPWALSFYLWDFPAWAAIPYIVVLFARFMGPYTLMLHATCHRALFKRKHVLLNGWVPWFLAPIFGQTPNSFFAHHMGMHHPENNLAGDLSGTLGYERDSFRQFLHYEVRFYVFGLYNLVRYLGSHRRGKLRTNLITGELVWWSGVACLLWLNPAATFVVFVLPMFMIRWFMMCATWSQHAFVDAEDPGNPFRNSNCLINIRYNHRAYNDGYHIVHHLQPALHWTQMATYFEENIEEFGRQDAIVFNGLGNNQVVWWALMFKNYGKLADHLVDLPGQKVRTREEKIAWLQGRVRSKIIDRPEWVEPLEQAA